jgi:hypothetical protein
MGSEETKKVEPEATSAATPSVPQEAPSDQNTTQDSPTEKTPAPVEKVSDLALPKNSHERDAALSRLTTDKRLALIQAWEENEKAKADNKAHKKLCAVASWENSRKASIEAELKQIEEQYEKKKAEQAEKINNNMAEIHKAAEEKRAAVEAQRGQEFIKVEEEAAKFRSTCTTPKKKFGCFSW